MARRQVLRLGAGGLLAAVPALALPRTLRAAHPMLAPSGQAVEGQPGQPVYVSKVVFQGLHCFSESDYDQISPNDEYYVLVNFTWSTKENPDLWASNNVRVPSANVFERISDDDTVPHVQHLIDVPANLDRLLMVAQLFEHDSGEPDDIDEAWVAVGGFAGALGASAGGCPRLPSRPSSPRPEA